MPKKSTIDLLPSRVRDLLQQHRASNPEWTLDDHMVFLSELDVDISRSALGRWFKDNPIASLSTMDTVRARTAALEAATLIYKGDSKDDLLSLAQDLLTWINSPDN